MNSGQVMSSDQTLSSGSVSVQAPQVPMQQTEKMLSQSEANRLIGREKASAYDKGYQDAVSESLKTTNTQHVQPVVQQQVGGIPQMTEDQIRKMISEEHAKVEQRIIAQQNEARAAEVVNTLMQKVEAAKAKTPDVEQKLAAMGIGNMPELLSLSVGYENSINMLLHLGENPLLLANILTLSRVNPSFANQEMRKLSESIKRNNSSHKTIDAPLTQYQASPVGAGNGDDQYQEQDIRALRNNPLFYG